MFSIEGKFFRTLSRFSDLVILNILFLLCCLPVITIGASITALYSVTKKMAENRESYIVKGFFLAFKENWKQSTIIWLILFLPTSIVSIDLYIGNFIPKGPAQTFFKGFILLALMIILFVLLYALTLQCTFQNTIRNNIKNALLISLAHTPWSILMVLLSISPFLCLLYIGQFFATELLAMLVIWFSGTAYINSFILNRIYTKYM